MRIAFASTYPPRRCGIAMFTSDLAATFGHREIVALTPPDHTGALPDRGPSPDPARQPTDYRRVARALDRCRLDAVSIQHEYGIWGGPDGEYVLDFVHDLDARPWPPCTRSCARRPRTSGGSSSTSSRRPTRPS